MIKQISIKSAYIFEEINNEQIGLLKSEKSVALIEGKLLISLVKFLKRPRSITATINHFKKEYSEIQVSFGIEYLRINKFLSESCLNLNEDEKAFYDMLDIEYSDAIGRLGAQKISIKPIGRFQEKNLRDIFRQHGIRLVSKNEDVCVIVTDDYLNPLLQKISANFARKRQNWILAKPMDSSLWLGPMFTYGKACYTCLAERLRANKQIIFIENKPEKSPSRLSKPEKKGSAFQEIYFQILATEITKLLVTDDLKKLEERIFVFDPIKFNIEEHLLVRRPQCKVCGCSSPNQAVNSKIVFKSVKKKFVIDGGHRVQTPESFWNKYKHHVSNITGVISSIDEVFKEENVFHICHSFFSFPLRYKARGGFIQKSLGRAGGKGLTQWQSKASALGESIERYSGLMQDYDVKVKGVMNDFLGDAIHPNNCMLFSEKQFDQPLVDYSNIKNKYTLAPARFDEAKKTDWTPLWSLTQSKIKYLPTGYCYYDYWQDKTSSEISSFCDSNGCASGDTYEEAFLQGIFELIERDAVGIWWFNQLQRPQVDINSVNIPYLEDLFGFFRKQNREFWVLDISNDFNIPVFAAVSRKKSGASNTIFGFGAHFDPKIALSRAVTEMAELFDETLKYEKSENKNDIYPLLVEWFETTNILKNDYLYPNDAIKPTKFSKFEYCPTDNLLTDVDKMIDILTKKGFEILVLDQTRPDVGLKVLRMVVPGLRHFWARFAPGRLFDVPLELGWLEKKIKEEELNAIPVFF